MIVWEGRNVRGGCGEEIGWEVMTGNIISRDGGSRGDTDVG